LFPGELAKAYASFLQEMFLDTKPVVSPTSVKSVLGRINEEYAGYSQQDAHEVIELLLDKLHEDTNRIQSKPYTLKLEGDGTNDVTIARDTWQRHLQRHRSFIQELFGSLMRSQLTCPHCGKTSVSYEYHNTIQIAIPRNYNITITVLFIPEIPSSKYASPKHPNQEFTLTSVTPSLWKNEFGVSKFTFTLDRYTSFKSLKKQLFLKLTEYQQRFYSEELIYFFESINPSKKLNNCVKMLKYVKEHLLINILQPNTILFAYGIILQEKQSFTFIHMVRTCFFSPLLTCC
jgi:uncharacterized UBP type Zn finger protein